MNTGYEHASAVQAMAEATSCLDIAQRIQHAALMAGGLSLVLGGVGVETHGAIERLVNPNCEATVTPSSLGKVETLLDAPAPTMQEAHNHAASYVIEHPWMRKDKDAVSQLTDTFFRQDMDAKYGVTTFDWVPTYNQMYKDYYRDPDSVSVESVNREFKLANEFLANYGITVAMASPKDTNIGGSRMVTLNTHNSSNIGYDLREIVQEFGGLPLQYVEASNTHEILFEELPQPRPGEVALAEVAGQSDSAIYVNPQTPIGDATITHELGHKTRYDECGSPDLIDKDTGYTALNKGASYNPKGWIKATDTGENFIDLQSTLSQSVQNKHRRREPYSAQDCKATKHLKASGEQDKFITPYASSAVQEDEAEQIGRLTLGYDFSRAINPALPTITAKSKYLLAEMYEDLPGSTAYFIAMGKLDAAGGADNSKIEALACSEPTTK